MGRKRKPQIATSKEEAKYRTCLKCFSTFFSLWAGNRICGKCKTSYGYKVAVDLSKQWEGVSTDE